MRPEPPLLAILITVASTAHVFAGDVGASRMCTIEDRASDSDRGRLARAIRGRGAVHVEGARLRTAAAVRRFYLVRGHRWAWLQNEQATLGARALIRALAEAHTHGLDARLYHQDDIARLFASLERAHANRLPPSRSVTLALELLLTDAFFAYGGHMLGGRVNPVDLDPEWGAKRREGDLVSILEGAVARRSVASALAALEPSERDYQRLRAMLAFYRKRRWGTLPTGGIAAGSAGPAVDALRSRLAEEGFVAGSGARFDANLVAALRQFQRTRGLTPSGRLDAATRAALDRPASDIASQLELNLERWRWLPKSLGHEHIVVNVPAFELTARRGTTELMRMDVIVGKAYRQTPVFSSIARQVVFHPHWVLPRRIAVEDKLPLIQRDRGYLARHHITVHGPGPGAPLIDPATIDWKSLSKNRFPYVLRQSAGPHNALGTIKLEMPNRFHVFLHDTPDRSLFRTANRAHSSGCIRVEKPDELARYVLGWSAERVRSTLAKRKQERAVSRPIPVHLLYWTAWVDAAGVLQLRPDIYQRDAALARALQSAKSIIHHASRRRSLRVGPPGPGARCERPCTQPG